MTTIVTTSRLTRVFGSGDTAVTAVDHVSLDVSAGELVLIKGPSGSGKTTLLSLIGGLLKPTDGQVQIEGRDITSMTAREQASLRAQRIGFVFQAYNLLSALSVEENILFPARLLGPITAEQRERASELINEVGLQHRRHALPRQLSGGEKQRVAVARALMNDPPLLLADEPTGNLDSQRGQDVAMVLHDLAKDQGRAVIIVTHDPRIEEIADRILWLEDGRLRDRKAEAHDWVHCPVCSMRVDKWTAIHVIKRADDELVFCSSRCRQKYEASPDQYAAQGSSGVRL